MALQFQPYRDPGIETRDRWSHSLDGIMQAYQIAKQQEQARQLQDVQMRSQNFGANPLNLTEDQRRQAYGGPAMSPAVPESVDINTARYTPAQPPQPMYSQNPDMAGVERAQYLKQHAMDLANLSETAKIRGENANAAFTENMLNGGGAGQLQNMGGQQVIVSPGKGGPHITPIGNQPGMQMGPDGRMTPIPGSEQEQKMREEQIAKQSKYDQGMLSVNNTLKNLEYLKSHADNWTTGYGSWLSSVPNTQAKAFNNVLEAVKSSLKVEGLMDLKSASPNGSSGFGNLSTAEGEAIAGKIAKLDPQDPKFLDKVNQIYRQLSSRRDQEVNYNKQRSGGRTAPSNSGVANDDPLGVL